MRIMRYVISVKLCFNSIFLILIKLDKDFPTLKQLANHINIHNRKGAHLCQTCGKQFTLPENLRRHQRIHAGIRPYQCHLCNR